MKNLNARIASLNKQDFKGRRLMINDLPENLVGNIGDPSAVIAAVKDKMGDLNPKARRNASFKNFEMKTPSISAPRIAQVMPIKSPSLS